MRFSFQSGVRNDLLQEIANNTRYTEATNFDRLTEQKYISILGPHATTTRFSHSGSANTKTLIVTASITIQRVSAPTVTGILKANLKLLRAASGAAEILGFNFQNATPEGIIHGSLNRSVVMDAGDLLTFYTTDPCTGGTVLYDCSVAMVEFDI